MFKISNLSLNLAGAPPVSFKKRKNSGFSQNKIKFGTSAISFNKTCLVEGIYLVFLKKKIKSFTKKNKKVRVWFFLEKNFPVSRKDKNSRMGKGKGSSVRVVFRVKKKKIVLEFKNVNIIFLKKVIVFFKKKTGISTSIFYIDQRSVFLGKFDYSFYNLFLKY